jgi:Tfp pilus assembly protein PilP
MKKLFLLMISLLVLAGCTTKSGVVSGGPDTYLVTHQAKTNFTNLDNLKAGTLQEATEYCLSQNKNEYCLSQNKNIRVVKTSVSPPKIFGNLPRASVQFMCLEKKDTDSPNP